MSTSTAESDVQLLYAQLLSAWNRRSGEDFGALFAEDAYSIGFDGSTMQGPAEITGHLTQIFAHHPTAAYVGIVQAVRLLNRDAALLRASVGMIPPGQTDLNPAANALQTLVATRTAGGWRIAAFQNTPAAFHGRPEASQQFTAELRAALRAGTALPAALIS